MSTLQEQMMRAIFGLVLLATSQVQAATYYWDSNNTTAGLGNTNGTWGTSAFFHNITNPDARGVIDGTLGSLADQNGTNADTFYFGTVNLSLGAAGSTIGIDAVAGVAANRIVFGAGQGSQGVTLSGGIITIAGALTAIGEIVANNTGTNTIGAQLAGANGLAVYGPGTLLLTGANTFTGGLIIRDGGTLHVGNGTSGSLTSQALTFNNGGGTFNLAQATGSSQGMGALTFTAFDGNIISTAASGSATQTLTFSSLVIRALGAIGNFSLATNTTAADNKIVLTGAATGFLDKGLFFGGSSYAAYDVGGYVRGLIYGTDTDAAVSGTITASNHVQLTSSPADRTGDTLLSLNLSGGGVNYTMNAGSLTVPAILKSGGGALSTISGGTSLTTASNAELVIRTDTSADLLTISSAITGLDTRGLTKTGAGTLTLSGVNTYIAATRINSGTLVVSGGSAIADDRAVILANAPGATFQLNASETIGSLSGGGFSGGTVNVQGNTLTIGATSTFGGQFSGTSGGAVTITSGTFTLSNKNTFLGAITLNGTSQLTFTYGNDATSSALALSSGGAINMAGGTTLNFSPGGNLLVGTLGFQLNVGSGWNIGNDIKVTSGTANITFGSGNGNIWTFNGGVSGSSTPATPTTLAVTTHASNNDTVAISFAGVIQDGTGGSLGLNLRHADSSAAGYINLTNSNTFTGAITMSTVGALSQNGFLVIGGTRTITGFTTGSGSLGSGGIYSNTISLVNSGAGVSILNYASSANQTLSGTISGANGRLQKDGSGTLTLSGANTFTGTTTVNDGTLVLIGSQCLSDTALLTIAANKKVQLNDREKVGSLTLIGASPPPPTRGTFGAEGTGASYESNTYFSGPGKLYVVDDFPPLGTLIMIF